MRQGDILSPSIFTAALEEIFRKVDVEPRINTNRQKKLNNLRFADIILLAEEEELRNILMKL